MPVDTKVVIVGGGIAGIKAAIELQKKGIRYTILEAKDRLGGRLHTVEGKNGKYDMGASWFHETLKNPLFDEEVGLSKELNFYFNDAPVKYIDRDGEIDPMLGIDPIMEEIYKFSELESYRDLDEDDSLYNVVLKYLREKKNILSDEQILKASQRAREVELWHGTETKCTSNKYAAVDNCGRNAMALHYDKVLKRHTDELDLANVKLQAVVKSICRVDKGRRVVVTTTAGDEFEADYAIVSVPQSILHLEEGSKGHIEFNPPLPLAITDSLKKMHYGALGKVVLEFDEVFWPTDCERFSVLASPPSGFLQAIKTGSEIPDYAHADKPKTWEHPVLFVNMATTQKIPSLVVLTQSPLTDYLESNPQYAWEYLRPMVLKLANAEQVPEPINVLVSPWTQDPYQRGSYTACHPGDDPLQSIIAFETGFGNVRFAGEHTILDGTGCVMGAWCSGTREATYIINHVAN